MEISIGVEIGGLIVIVVTAVYLLLKERARKDFVKVIETHPIAVIPEFIELQMRLIENKPKNGQKLLEALRKHGFTPEELKMSEEQIEAEVENRVCVLKLKSTYETYKEKESALKSAIDKFNKEA